MNGYGYGYGYRWIDKYLFERQDENESKEKIDIRFGKARLEVGVVDFGRRRRIINNKRREDTGEEKKGGRNVCI